MFDNNIKLLKEKEWKKRFKPLTSEQWKKYLNSTKK